MTRLLIIVTCDSEATTDYSALACLFVQESTHHLMGTVRNKQKKRFHIFWQNFKSSLILLMEEILHQSSWCLGLLPSRVSGYFFGWGGAAQLSCWSGYRVPSSSSSAYWQLPGRNDKDVSTASKDTHDINTWRNKTDVNETSYDQHWQNISNRKPSVPFLGMENTKNILMSTHAPKSGKIIDSPVSAISFHQQNQKRQWNGIIL